MKPMSDKVFLDTNILVYSYSSNEPEKQKVARQLITENNTVISTQVIQELINTVTKKFKFNYDTATLAAQECIQNNVLHVNTETTIMQACTLAGK
jgi:predicted nucleic acid-binding protein